MNSVSDLPVLVKPSLLKKGDTIGIVAPSSPTFQEGKLLFALERFAELGLKVKLGKHIYDAIGDLAGADKDRASDLNTFFQDPEIKAIFAVRSGNGSARLLPMLDWEAIKSNPKIIIGYSDVTALLLAIHQKTGLVTFHGPTAVSFFESPYTYEYFIKALMGKEPIGVISDPEPKHWAPEYPPTRMILQEGEGEGPLVGGCLMLIKQLMGTPYEIDTRGKILFIEDVEEEPHSIDRMISQLFLAGKFDQVVGVIIGECVGCKPGASARRRLSINLSIEQIFKERFSDFHAPVIYGMRLGHSSEKMTLPLGVKARLSAKKSQVVFSIDEAATL